MLDYIAYYYIIKIITKYNENYKKIWLTRGELDTAISVVYYRRFLDKEFSKPEFIQDEKIAGRDMYHPLINNSVVNDFQFQKGVLLTGANASGKSAFLKAIAINAIDSGQSTLTLID